MKPIDPKDYGIDIDKLHANIMDIATKPVKEEEKETITRDMEEKYQAFAHEHFGFEFHDIRLLVTALTHRSYINEHRNAHVEHNERLEFLGDAILEMVTSDFLYRNFYEQEGMMTAWRAALVRTESIGEASREIGYEPLVRMSHGERSGADRSHSKIIADCFEATTAAIYLDQGFETARDYIYKHIITHMEGILNEGSWRDPKSYLQELAQKAEGVTPQYHVVKEEGPDHLKTFTINVVINGHLRGTGTGHSKLEAQNNAAREGVKYYKSQKVSTNGRLTL